MNNRFPVNRVETALSQWRSREERFSKMFSLSLSSNKALLKEKLRYFEQIEAKYKGTQNLDERFALKVLRQERKQMERELYSNFVSRLLRRLIIVPVRERITANQDNRKTEENNQSLQHQVQRAGFFGLSTKIAEQTKEGQQQFSIPVSYYLNDKERVDQQLSFSKDPSGQYYFEGFKTALYNEAKPAEKRQQYFSMRHEHAVNTTEAYNLLSGRYIQNGSTWLQLDFNDKDQQGNFRVKQFHADYGYDIDKVLQQLPLKELLNKEEEVRLKEALKNGHKALVSFMKDGREQRFYIEANPQFKSVNIYDEHSRKISLHTALGNKTMDTMKVVNKASQQQQSHERKNGMRMT
ncbi:MAG TPA: hypothetical protein VFI29_14760 [Hanamia sp.]|nr:hypothetical protein [Hanamia sp.]